jgi:hypothetical protein
MAVDMIAATVHAGAAETPYLRAGRGEPLVLLTARTAADLANDALMEALVEQFRVIVPALPAAPIDDAWLWGVLDCLGVQQARILVDATVANGGAAAAVVRTIQADTEPLT